MPQENVLDTIRLEYSSLTKSAKKVADLVFEKTVEVQYMSITTFSEECGVAEATISRFCQALGYSGYNNFKLALAKLDGDANSVDDEEIGIVGKIKPSDSILDMSKKLYAADVAAISQTLALINEQEVARAVQYITGAQRVYCFGQGGSLVIAMEAWARFITCAPHFQCIEDSHMQAMAASLCTINDVILFFSYSGATKEMQDVLRPAKARGTKIVLFTHFEKSPAIAYADVVLLCGSKEGPLQSGSVAAKMGLMFLIDVIFNEYCRVNPEFSERNREATAEAIAAKLL